MKFSVGNRVRLLDNDYYLDAAFDDRFSPGTEGTVVGYSSWGGGGAFVEVQLDTYDQKALVFLERELEFVINLNLPAVNTGD